MATGFTGKTTPKQTFVALALPLSLVAALAWYGGARITRAMTPSDRSQLIALATSSDGIAARNAITALRAQGPVGLQALCAVYNADIQRHLLSPNAPHDARWTRIAAALDGVGRQKDCYASRLYWYTDLAQAQREAQATSKPILSLRLLGNLDEDLSCANSRFFRTALYPNAAVSEYLRTHYILHWKSVRPVPTFTLDFGDGRKIVRTLTGNSIHYVLDSKGRTVDALPGLYGPQAFLRHLTEDAAVAQKSASMKDDAQQDYLASWHQARFEALAQAWTTDCAQAYGKTVTAPSLDTLIQRIGISRSNSALPPTALSAAPIAVSKFAGEGPVVTALSASNPWAVGMPALEWAWDQMGQVHAEDAVLDANSRSVIAAKKPDLSRVPSVEAAPAAPRRFGLARQGGFSGGAPQQAVSPTLALDPMTRLITLFERSVAQDSVRNEYIYHAKLHQWFADGGVTGNVEALNSRVYSDLFLTPNTDPWLGLAPAGVYTGLPYDGLVQSSATKSQIATR